MADVKISALPAVVTPAAADEFVVNQGGTSRKETRAQVHALESGEHLVLPQVDEAGTPTLAFGNGNTGFYEQSDDNLSVAIGGARKWLFAGNNFQGNENTTPILRNVGATSTTPNISPSRGDQDTGLGTAAADQLSLIAGAIEGIRLSTASSHVLLDNEIHTGLTASTNQTQGQGALLSSYNDIDTVANPNDVVTAPAAAAGRRLLIINDGDNDLQVFPASGDNLGAGSNISIVIEPGQSNTYTGVSSTVWHTSASSITFHAEMQHEGNGVIFGVASALNEICYHSAAVLTGDLLGWTFDAGGAGTSFPIASIADGADPGVDIEVTTTGTHGLAQFDIVSQSNLTNPVYEGVFIVKAIISTTEYEVAAVFAATDTGTMDQAATLTANTGSTGDYMFVWAASATTDTNNETFDFHLFKGGTIVSGKTARNKFGTANDFQHVSGAGIVSITAGDKISFVVDNQDTAGDITIRNFNVSCHKL